MHESHIIFMGVPVMVMYVPKKAVNKGFETSPHGPHVICKPQNPYVPSLDYWGGIVVPKGCIRILTFEALPYRCIQ